LCSRRCRRRACRRRMRRSDIGVGCRIWIRLGPVLIKFANGDSDLIKVRFGAPCGLKSDISRGPRSAMSGLMHRSKPHRYSISTLTLSPESRGERDALLFGERRVGLTLSRIVGFLQRTAALPSLAPTKCDCCFAAQRNWHRGFPLPAGVRVPLELARRPVHA
jgi:hypothetical protein